RSVCSASDLLDHATIWRPLCPPTADIVLDKVSLYRSYPPRHGIVTTAVANGFALLLSSITHNHRHSDTAGLTCRFELRLHFPNTSGVFQTDSKEMSC